MRQNGLYIDFSDRIHKIFRIQKIPRGCLPLNPVNPVQKFLCTGAILSSPAIGNRQVQGQ